MCSHYSCFSLPWSPKVKSAYPTFPRLSHRTTVNPGNATLYCVFKPKCRCLHLSLAGNILFVPFPIFLECYYQIKEYICFCGSTSVLLNYSWKWHNLFIHSTTSSEVGLAHLLQVFNTIHYWSHWDWEFGSSMGNSLLILSWGSSGLLRPPFWAVSGLPVILSVLLCS